MRFPEELWVMITDLKRHKRFRAELAAALARARVEITTQWTWEHTVGRAVHNYEVINGNVWVWAGHRLDDGVPFPYAERASGPLHRRDTVNHFFGHVTAPTGLGV